MEVFLSAKRQVTGSFCAVDEKAQQGLVSCDYKYSFLLITAHFQCLEAVACRLGWLVAVVMANVIETMCCEIAFRLDGGDLGVLCVRGG